MSSSSGDTDRLAIWSLERASARGVLWRFLTLHLTNPNPHEDMPSFVCDYCQETLKKAKLDQHAQRCRQAAFSCIDCYKTFKGVEYRAHTTCITEVQKHHTIKNKEGQQVQGKRNQLTQVNENPVEVKKEAVVVPEKRSSSTKNEEEKEKKSAELTNPREHLIAVLTKKQPQTLKEVKKSLKKYIKDKKQMKAAKKWLKTISFSLEGKEIRMKLE